MDRRHTKFICVTYDVDDDKRRNRLRKTLRRFGQAVQYSLFECWLTRHQIDEMQEAVARIVAEGDSVRYYDLCSACHRQTVTIGIAETTRLKQTYIF